MKKWVLVLLIATLGGLPIFEIGCINSRLWGQVEITPDALTQFPLTTEDQVWELLSLARQSQTQQALQSLAEAWKLAQTIETPEVRNSLLVDIIGAYTAIGAQEEAIALAAQISYEEKLSHRLGDSLRIRSEVIITQAYLADGKQEEALEFAQSLQFEPAKIRALVALVAAYAETGQFEQAEALSRTIESDSYQKYQAEAAIIEEYIKKGDYEAGLAFVSGISNEENRYSAASTLAEAAWQGGRYNLAFKISEQITTASQWVQLLQSLADAHLAVGQKSQASAIITEAFELSQQVGEIPPSGWLEDFLKTGQDEQVNKLIANLSSDPNEAAFDRSLLANSYLNLGDYKQAFAFAKEIPDRVLLPLLYYRDPKVELFDSIIKQALAAGDYNFAEQVASTLTEKPDQVAAWRQIAHKYANNGAKQRALTTLNQAVSIAQTIEQISVVPERSLSWAEPNASILVDLADDYSELGQKTAAMATLALATASIASFEDQYAFNFPVWNKSESLRAIASRYQKLEQLAKVRELLAIANQEAQEIQGDRHLVPELLAIAEMYWEIGEVEATEPILEQVKQLNPNLKENPDYHLTFSTRMAILQAKIGQTEAAIQILEPTLTEIESLPASDQTYYLMQMMRAYAAIPGQEKTVRKLITTTLEQIQTLEEPFKRNQIQETLAQVIARLNQPQFAWETALQVKERSERGKMLLVMAMEYAKQDNPTLATEFLDTALTVIATIRTEEQRNAILLENISRLADLPNLSNQPLNPTWEGNMAVAITQGITSPKTQRENLLSIAVKYLEAQETQAAEQTLATALNIAPERENSLSWRQKLIATSEAAIQHKQYNIALQIAQEIDDELTEIAIMRQVAQKYAVTGDLTQAQAIMAPIETMAQQLVNPQGREETLAGIQQQQKNW